MLVNICELWRENFLVKPSKQAILACFLPDSWDLQLQDDMQVLHQRWCLRPAEMSWLKTKGMKRLLILQQMIYHPGLNAKQFPYVKKILFQ